MHPRSSGIVIQRIMRALSCATMGAAVGGVMFAAPADGHAPDRGDAVAHACVLGTGHEVALASGASPPTLDSFPIMRGTGGPLHLLADLPVVSRADPRGTASRRSSVALGHDVLQTMDQATLGDWTQGPALPVRIAEVAGAALDGAVYTGGGFTPPGGSIGKWFGRLESGASEWTPLADMPVAVHHPGLTAAAGRVWLAGGYTGQLRTESATRRLDAYDPETDTWTRMPDMPGRRGAHAFVALEGKLYVAGGVGDSADRMWIYDIATEEWSETAGPIRREHLGGAASGGQLYILAGRGYGLGDRSGILEAYDPVSDTWERLEDMPGACGGCSAAATSDGRIHITGGETFSAASGGRKTYRDHYVFDPETGQWTEDAPMPTARHGIAAAPVGAAFYVVGGGHAAGLDYSTTVEIWRPASSPATDTPSPTAEVTPTEEAGATPSPAPTSTAIFDTWSLFIPRAGRN